MKNNSFLKFGKILLFLILLASCKALKVNPKVVNTQLPKQFKSGKDTINVVDMKWRAFFNDEALADLIDTALVNNKELNILMMEIEMSQNGISMKKGAYLPFLKLGWTSSVEKTPRYTRLGAVEEQLQPEPGTSFPSPIQDHAGGILFDWEVDIWKKLRNEKQATALRYLETIDGRNFMVTKLIAEIAESFYELQALDNMLDILNKNIEIQTNALFVVKKQMEFARVTQLAVNRFEAQLLHTTTLKFQINQRIVETENRLFFLTGKFPDTMVRSKSVFLELAVDTMSVGIPVQLLQNRPDIHRAELEMAASKLDVLVAKAAFYPRLDIHAGVGLQAFKPSLLINPQSMLFNMAGDLMAPMVNRLGLKAELKNANAKQYIAVFNYEQSLINAYVDVLNEMSRLNNGLNGFLIKTQEVDLLNKSVVIAQGLFNSARADYSEVLFTQREALEAKMELVELKLGQLKGKVRLYRALGGGWK